MNGEPRGRNLVLGPWLPAVAIVIAISVNGSTFAGFPPLVSDEELAQRPIIVIARWDKAPKVRVDLPEGMPAKSGERTTLVVTRVITGDIKPGQHEVILGPSIGWSEDFPWITSATSPQSVITGRDPRQPNLWLLKRERGIVGDAREYFVQDNCEGVRHLVTEPYFVALRSKDPRVEVPKLLASKDNEVVLLALKWVCGGNIPSPSFESNFPIRWASRVSPIRNPRTECLGAVEALLKHDDLDIRRAAINVVGDWADKTSLPKLRRLLTDSHPDVRAAVVIMLASLDDRDSSEAINEAVKGIDEYVGEVICALAAWKNPNVVPALIAYLEDEGPGEMFDDHTLNLRCLLAQCALEQITGHTFPLDVDVATRIWRLAAKLADAGRREAFLTRALPKVPIPLTATLVREREAFSIIVTNTSRRPVSIARTPQSIEVSYKLDAPNEGSRGGGEGGDFDGMVDIDGKDSFVELEPGASMRFDYHMKICENKEQAEDFVLAGPGGREVKLSYERNGHEYGLKAWVGELKVSTDSIDLEK